MSRRAADEPDLARALAHAPPETAALDLKQLAAWLQVGVKTALAQGFRCYEISPHNRRWLVKWVIEDMEERMHQAA